MNDQDKPHIFDKPANVKRLLYSLYALAAGLIVADIFIHRHVAHPLERLFGFYGVYGFVAIVILVLAAKELRKIVLRDEDYYDG